MHLHAIPIRPDAHFPLEYTGRRYISISRIFAWSLRATESGLGRTRPEIPSKKKEMRDHMILGMFHSTRVRESLSKSAKRPEAVVAAPAPGPLRIIESDPAAGE